MTDIPSGYTPGPWKVYHAKLRPQFSTVVIEVQPRAGGRPIVAWSGFDNGHVTKKRHLANARLIALAPEMADEIVRLRAEVARLQEALTPSGATKAAYIGEFHFTDSYIGEDGNDVDRKVAVPWTTVKEIMVAIRARAALTAQEKTDDKA